MSFPEVEIYLDLLIYNQFILFCYYLNYNNNFIMLSTVITILAAVLVPFTSQYMDVLGQLPAGVVSQFLAQSGMSMDEALQLMSTQEGQQLAQQAVSGQMSMEQLQQAAQNLAQQPYEYSDSQQTNDYYSNNLQSQTDPDSSYYMAQQTDSQNNYQSQSNLVSSQYMAQQSNSIQYENSYPLQSKIDSSQYVAQQSNSQKYVQYNYDKNGLYSKPAESKSTEQLEYSLQSSDLSNNGLLDDTQKQDTKGVYLEAGAKAEQSKLEQSYFQNNDITYQIIQENDDQQESVDYTQKSLQQTATTNTDVTNELPGDDQNKNVMKQYTQQANQIQPETSLQEPVNVNTDGLEQDVQSIKTKEMLGSSENKKQQSNVEDSPQPKRIVTYQVLYIPNNSNKSNRILPYATQAPEEEKMYKNTIQGVVNAILSPVLESLDLQNEEDTLQLTPDILQPILEKYNATADKNASEPKDVVDKDQQLQVSQEGADSDKGVQNRMFYEVFLLMYLFIFASLL
eukprot:TRINITY_DN2569_c0_g1_i1.p2 TRINITY_DN2569_c0_g1~~TRINITY_DN2569_c0_g1_i1.p2  ORF type:complete len:509 (-),score=48.18 TRINITY_DN2569_c0_g1_i1:128-1654(-)